MLVQEKKIKVAVCGTADGKLSRTAIVKARKIGRLLAEHDVVVVNGATIGYTYEAAKAAKRAGAFSLGISPAKSREEHVRHYKRPLDGCDAVVFTGLGFPGRNVVLVQSADAAIFIGGGTGTLNEFTIAYNLGKPIGILTGVEGTMELVDQIVEKTYRASPAIIKEEDPKRLVARVVTEAKRQIRLSSKNKNE